MFLLRLSLLFAFSSAAAAISQFGTGHGDADVSFHKPESDSSAPNLAYSMNPYGPYHQQYPSPYNFGVGMLAQSLFGGINKGFSFTPQPQGHKDKVSHNDGVFGNERQKNQDIFRGAVKYNLDLCFYLGDDVRKSHLNYDPRWNNGTSAAFTQYINDLAFRTNVIMNRVDEAYDVPNYDFQLRWAGPWERSDTATRYPEKAPQDTIAASKYGCDATVFLVFNDYTQDPDGSDGHKFSGIAEGGVCEGSVGKGFAIIVDQGYLGDHWVGPQILAHHLFLLMTSDLYLVAQDNNNQQQQQQRRELENRGCPKKGSIMHESVYPGEQWRDDCVESKLRRSWVAHRECLLK